VTVVRYTPAPPRQLIVSTPDPGQTADDDSLQDDIGALYADSQAPLESVEGKQYITQFTTV
jgi:hypothetical protein